MSLLTFLDLEPRIAPDAGMGETVVTRDDAATVTGAEVVRQHGRLWLVVTVAARCPACLLRADGVVREAGDGTLRVEFPVRPGTTQIDIEMAEPGGEFSTVRRVGPGADGESSMTMGADGMGMAMGGAMTTHPEATTVMTPAKHGDQPTSHGPRPAGAHAEMVRPHSAPEAGGMRMDAHRVSAAAAGGPAADAHSADGDPFAEPADGGHTERMPAGPPVIFFRVEEEEPAPPPADAGPEPAATATSTLPGVPEETPQAAAIWPLVLGGVVVTVSLVAASHVLERHSRRGRRVVVRPPGRRDRRPARTWTTASPFESASSRPTLQPVGG